MPVYPGGSRTAERARPATRQSQSRPERETLWSRWRESPRASFQEMAAVS